MQIIADILAESFLDTVRLLPFLFLTYLVMEYLEDRAEEKTTETIRKAGRFGPLCGALLGLLPQCGFSAAASGLYAGGVITAGTLMAVFLSTSDEMLPILLSESVPFSVIGRILLAKMVIGALTGLGLDAVLSLLRRKGLHTEARHIHDLCEQDDCRCEEGSIFLSALRHTAKVIFFIFVITFGAGLLIGGIGEEAFASFLTARPAAGVFLSALIGLIPNCGASVTITELYLKGFLSGSQMLAGLLTGAGVGLPVLYRNHRRIKEDLLLTCLLYASGVFWGLLFMRLPVFF